MTLFYWFKSVPADRPYGPWWHERFESEKSMKEFLAAIEPCLKAYCITNNHICDFSCKLGRCSQDAPHYLDKVVFLSDSK